MTECQERCNAYPGAFVFTTIAEVADTANLEETLATRGEHEAVTKEIRKILQTKFEQTLPCRRIPVKFAEPVPTRMHRAVIRIIWCHALKDTGSW